VSRSRFIDGFKGRVWLLRSRGVRLLQLARALGVGQALVYVFQTYASKRLCCTRPYVLLSKHACYPLFCRPNTSDRDVFRQIFIRREYSCLDDLTGGGLIIDCGANVGYTSAYLLSRFPSSHVVAVEPSPSNFRLLTRNLAPYGERVTLVESAVWSHPVGLKLSRTQFRDGREWTHHVEECQPDEVPEMQATTIPALLADSGFARIFVLKVDIEGAESAVFAGDCETWLPRVDNIAIELHDDSPLGPASPIFHRAIRDRPYEVSHSGELTVCRLPGPV
jgi:FkbM family methyltransferase